ETAIPVHAKKRLSQIKRLCKKGYLSTAYSCVFNPKGPSSAAAAVPTAPVSEDGGGGVSGSGADGGSGGSDGVAAPVIYVEAPHMYYLGRVPRMPPCPKHGWQPDGEVEAKGWTKGRRVSGVLEDAYLLGTKHVCKVCRRQRTALEERLKASPAAPGDEAESRRRRREALRKSSYVFRSYDPEVSRMYVQRFPWMAAQTSGFVFTKKKAMTQELALLLRQMQHGPGGTPVRPPRTLAEREIQVRQAIERVRRAQSALAEEIDAEHRDAALAAQSASVVAPLAPPPRPRPAGATSSA
ncbi:unnamed protein product, partial [Scytosiphon promiscuus]